MSAGNLPENLRLLCSHYRSVAEVCRRIGVNRQQFNKYLSGQTTPSLFNLRRIGDFFGIDETELLLPHDDFVSTVLRRPRADGAGELGAFVANLNASFPESQNALKPYCGYYYSYFYSPAWPGYILRGLVAIFQSGNHTYSKFVERLVIKTQRQRGLFVFKYQGVLLYASNRIHLFEWEPKLNRSLAMTVFYPTRRNSIILVSGLLLSVSGNHAGQPFASRIVYEYLGASPDLRAALDGCGIYEGDSPEIDEEIRRRIDNSVERGDQTLRAPDF
jgi:transcriptional regulator with XRE-family HTH domain